MILQTLCKSGKTYKKDMDTQKKVIVQDFYEKDIISVVLQGSTITAKRRCQNFGVRDVHRQIPKSIYQAPCFLLSDFPNNFP